ncbi:Ankyrin repeat-containing domain protein [Cordyceps fumosorosea ARSEF 2679]|uniref:Ankyrin repeat-containing domain protein n=1 Tax=Cordyceps fumosorosea (strain ARSEF 2679) TaxID=1081104 RepID=A0A168DB55_CORFA|nr:Ankyrin repeat-containing domain protein [Cordyceps fumosorosea ARSEF 2679]OAA72387.1 Ankyrin repeat-containing domain protein [Cordyceps fumosorosea ARSEF 2679]
MAPQLTEDEIDDLIYFARAGEDTDLMESVIALAEREKVAPAVILMATKDKGKSTVLHMATGNGHLETVRKVIQCFDERPKEEKQAFLDEPNEHGNTGMHWAALSGHLDTVRLLMEHGASPALANERDYVPLDLANQNEKTEVSEYFLSFLKKLESENTDEGLNNAAASIEVDEAAEDGKAEASS